MCGQPACWLPSKTENKNDIPFAHKTILKDKPGDPKAEFAKAVAELREVRGWKLVNLDQVKFIKPPGHAPLLESGPEAPPAEQKTEEQSASTHGHAPLESAPEAPPAKKQKTDEEPAPAKEQKTEEQSASTPITPPGPTV